MQWWWLWNISNLPGSHERQQDKMKEAGVMKELDYMERNNSRTKTVLSPGKDSIPGNVILKQKLDAQGRIAHYKARLVTNSLRLEGWCGLRQDDRAVIPLDVLTLIVGKFTSVGWHVRYADICTAFLSGDFDGTCSGTITAKIYRVFCTIRSSTRTYSMRN